MSTPTAPTTPAMAAHDVQAANRVFNLLLQHAQGHLGVFHQLCGRLHHTLAWCDRQRPTLSTLVQAARQVTATSAPALIDMLGKAAQCDSWAAAMEIIGALHNPQPLQPQVPPAPAPINLLSTSPPHELTARAADLAHCAPLDRTPMIGDLADTAISPQKKRPLDNSDQDAMQRYVRQRQARAALERRTQNAVALSQAATMA